MPYINPGRRNELMLLGQPPANPGELNYVITCLLTQFWEKDKSYTTGNAIMGALNCAGMEFYRRVLVPYEEGKMKENGDVY
jgi:hypothetical protein